MKPEIKIMIVGAILCVIGAILLDCKIQITGYTLLTLGASTIVFSPVIASF